MFSNFRTTAKDEIRLNFFLDKRVYQQKHLRYKKFYIQTMIN